MSRVGKAPITVPAKVTVTVDKGNLVKVAGPKGALSQQLSLYTHLTLPTSDLV